MRIRQIDLDDNSEPESVMVKLSIAEAALITRMLGKLTDADPVAEGLYEGFTGSLFNRFWEDGVEGVRER